jgi:hypothetical protein
LRASSIGFPFGAPGWSERYFAAVTPISDAPRELNRTSPRESRMIVVSGAAGAGAVDTPAVGVAVAPAVALGGAAPATPPAPAALSAAGVAGAVVFALVAFVPVAFVLAAFDTGRCGGVGKSRGVSHRTRKISSAAIAMRRVIEPERETGRA